MYCRASAKCRRDAEVLRWYRSSSPVVIGVAWAVMRLVGCGFQRGLYKVPVLLSSQLQCAPEIPAGDTAVGAPSLAASYHGCRLGQFASQKHQAEPFPNSEVDYRKHVGTAQTEHQQHLHCPAPDAANLGEALNNLLIFHSAYAGE